MKAQLTTIDQRPEDLVLAILNKQQTLPLKNLVQRQVDFGPYTIEFHIIGESHRIRVMQRGQFVLEEILACVQLSKSICRHRHAFINGAAHRYHALNYDVQVSFTTQPEWQHPGVDSAYIAYAFPAINDFVPLTRIQWQQNEAYIRWWTLHTYHYHATTTYVHSVSTIRCE